MSNTLVAGAAKLVITPPVGVDLTGFGGREGPAIGIHDDLRAGAVYLCDGATPAVVITADLIGLAASEVTEVRALIAEATDIPAANVMICCSHTHSGPATTCLDYLGKADEAYLSVLKRQLAGAAKIARDSARPALFGNARQPVSVGINRREARAGGGIILGRNETGLTAPFVDVWSFDDAETKAPIARLFSHAAHAVTLGGDNLRFSADWPGYAQRAVEHIFPDTPALFAQGCCGNINSDPRGTFEVAALQGQVMGGAVAQADGRTVKRSEARIGVTSATAQLLLSDPPPVDEARALLAQVTQERDAAAATDNYGWKMLREGLVQWAQRILDLAEAGATGRTLPYEVMAISCGDAAWVGLPGEVFVEYALNIDRDSPFATTTVAAYSNGNPGYVPTAAAFAEGGYEVDNAIRYYGDTMMTAESEQIILDTAAQLLVALSE